jgi:CRISPR-associated protein Csb2
MILEIEVTLTAGHFHGEEWPPAPARLFQALVAGSHRGAHGLIHQQVRDEALRWLEQQEPPSILAPEAVRQREHLINYVPNNDDGFGPDSHIRTDKGLGAWFFPPGSAVAYQWQLPGEPVAAKPADVIAAMSALVTSLGRTVDLAYARGRVLDAPVPLDGTGRKRWQPAERDGGRWLAPAAGFLELLDRRFPRSVSSEPPDFTNTRQVSYEVESVLRLSVPLAVFEMLRMDGRKLAFDPRDLRQPAGMVRNAMVRWAEATPGIRTHFPADLLARFVQGHKSAAASERSEGGHFAVVPLPSVNPPSFTADGWLRRVAVIGYGVAQPVEQELFRELTRGLHGALLQDNGKPRGELRLLTPREQQRVMAPLVGPANCWRSLTPVILTGFTRKGRAAEACLLRVLGQQGLRPEDIESVAAFTGPIVPTAQPARAYRVQGYLTTTPRVHAEIIFRRPVEGPLVLGRGRFTGFGLLAPVVAQETD